MDFRIIWQSDLVYGDKIYQFGVEDCRRCVHSLAIIVVEYITNVNIIELHNEREVPLRMHEQKIENWIIVSQTNNLFGLESSTHTR